MLEECGEPLWQRYDLALLDLDGVVYVGARAVRHAPDVLAAARAAGMHLAFVTNNASRPPETVAAHLTDLGILAAADEVVTSAQAAAHLLAGLVPAGSAVYVIGGTGLLRALEEEGLRPVQTLEDDPAAVVSGYHPDLRWRTVIDGAILVRQGLPWVASNTDATVPTAHGPGPGNGALVRVVAEFAGRTPVVAGKPEPPLFRETIRRVGGRRPLVVGDRLDTDIEGANRTGVDSLLVMTGVTDATELVAAPPALRPSYVAADLRALGEPHGRPVDGRLGGWVARLQGDRLVLTGNGTPHDWWRLLASEAWRHLDATGRPVDLRETAVPGSVGADSRERV